MNDGTELVEEYRQGKYSAYKASKLASQLGGTDEAKGYPHLNISVLGTVTLNFLADPLKAQGLLEKINLDVSFPPAEQIMQQVLAPQSELYQANPDIILLIARLEDLYPPLFDPNREKRAELFVNARQEVLSQFRSWLAAIRQNSNATVVLHTLTVPSWASDVLNETVESNSIWRLVTETNLVLADLADDFSGVFVVNTDRIIDTTPNGCWHDPKLWYIGRISFGSKDPRALVNAWMPVIRQVLGVRKKCLVLDLDNTLWGGVVGEDGMAGIKIGADFPGNVYQDVQKQILDLWQNGVMLAIASKNNEADAKEIFDNHPDMILKWDHFLVRKINWNDKAGNIREISRELNIGLDHMVFLDDNPVECSQVSQEIPGITVLQVPVNDICQYPEVLSVNRLFDGLRLTSEDKERNQMYTANLQRDAARSETTDLGEFLKTLDMEASIAPVRDKNISRTYQMLGKTNQFNLTAKRYSEAEVCEIAENRNWHTYAAGLKDKFGDNGQVALAFVKIEGDSAEIDTFLMSCRVISRGLETALLDTIIGRLKKCGIKNVMGKYIPTAKNIPVKEFYERHNFELVEEMPDGVKHYCLSLEQKTKLPDYHIDVTVEL